MFLKKQIKGESCIFTSSQFVHNEYFIQKKNPLQTIHLNFIIK